MSADHWYVNPSIVTPPLPLSNPFNRPVRPPTPNPVTDTDTPTDNRRDELQKRLGELRAHVTELKAMDQSAATSELQKRKQLDACGRCADGVLEAR